MKRVLLVLTLWSAGVVPAAAAPASGQARAEVGQQVRQVDILLAARARLTSQRAALQADADRLNGRIADAKRHRSVLTDAGLKALLRDALQVGQQLEALDRKLAALDQRIEDTAGGLERVVARLPEADRASVQGELRRIRAALPREPAASAPSVDVQVTAGMDAEALRERADLASDYEEKLRKEVERTETRMRQLQDQQAVAGEAQLMNQDRRLFDEDDRSLRASRVVQRTQARSGEATAGGADGPAAAVDPGARGSDDNAAPGEGFAGAVDNAEGSGGNAPPPAAYNNNTTTGGVNTQRSQTVVDERTFALLRESRSPSVAASPMEEMRQLQARREALLKAAARLKALRQDLNRQAQQR